MELHQGLQYKNRFQSCINRLFPVSPKISVMPSCSSQRVFFRGFPFLFGLVVFRAVQRGTFRRSQFTLMFHQASGQHFPPCSQCIPWALWTSAASRQGICGITQCCAVSGLSGQQWSVSLFLTFPSSQRWSDHWPMWYNSQPSMGAKGIE